MSINDVKSLNCVLKTGEVQGSVDWTDARQVQFEKKMSNDSYKPVQNETIVYEGVDLENKPIKGYINNFQYVAVAKIKDTGSANKNLRCENLITPEQNPLLRLKPNHDYKIRFQLTGDYLRALVVAPPKDLPFQSLAYSIDLLNGNYAMPIGGYKVRIGHLEQSVNSDFQGTNILGFTEVDLASKKGYKTETDSQGITQTYHNSDDVKVAYVHVPGNFEPFKSLDQEGQKIDVYPKSLLRGDWYYSRTVVRSNISIKNPQFFLTIQSSDASKVRAEFKNNYLVIYDLNVEKKIEDIKSVSTDRVVLKIPIQNLEYESNQSGSIINAGLVEVVNNKIKYLKKRFVKINFDGLELASSYATNTYLQSGSNYVLENLVFSNDYISFTLYDEASDVQVKYSLLRPAKSSTYNKLALSEASYNLFPAFFSRKRVHNYNFLQDSESYENPFLINRFNTNKPIVYRFSTITPKADYVRNIGREAISHWNAVFQKAEVSCPLEGCFILDESADAELGDLRYSVLNITDPRSPANRFAVGYGPSVSDFETGEVISATTNLFLGFAYEDLASSAIRYVLTKSGLGISDWKPAIMKQSRFSRSPTSNFESDSSFYFNSLKQKALSFKIEPLFISKSFAKNLSSSINLSNSSNKIKIYGSYYNQRTNSIEAVSSLDQIFTSEQDRNQLALNYQMMTGKKPASNFRVDDLYGYMSNENTNQDQFNRMQANHSLDVRYNTASYSGSGKYDLVEAFCGNSLNQFISKEKSPVKILNDLHLLDRQTSSPVIAEFANTINVCAQKLLAVASLRTATHEIGHNLGMFHNFKGSFDKDNFMKLEDFELKYVTSQFTQQEKETLLNLKATQPSTSTVMDYADSSIVNLIPGAYDVGFARFIYGSKIENKQNKIIKLDSAKIAKKDIRHLNLKEYKYCTDYHAYLGEDPYCKRFDNGTTATEIVQDAYNFWINNHDSVRGFSYATRHIYQKWRLELSTHLKTFGSDTLYLTDFKTKEFSKIKSKLCSKGSDVYDLCQAAKKITDTYINQIFYNPDHYCFIAPKQTHKLIKPTDRVPFSQLLSTVTKLEDFRGEYSSCYDMEDLINASGYVLISEHGRPLFSESFSSNISNSSLYFDAGRKGTISNKIDSLLNLVGGRFNRVARMEFLHPIRMIDEPDIREQAQSLLRERIILGETVGGYDKDGKQKHHLGTLNFTNEFLFLRLSTFLLSMGSNITNPVSGINNNVENRVEITRSVNQKKDSNASNISIANLQFYNHLKDRGLYRFNSDSGETSILLKPFFIDQSTDKLLQTAQSIYFKKGLISVWDKFLEIGAGNEFDKNADVLVKYKAFNKYINEIVDSIQHLLHGDVVVQAATLTYLYDYLEGKYETPVTDSLIPVLQFTVASTIMKKIYVNNKNDKNDKDDQKTKILGNIVPLTALKNSKGDKKGIFTGVMLSAGSQNHKNYIINQGKTEKINLFKPHLDFLKDYFEKYPDEIGQYAQLLSALNSLQKFRSDKYKDSQINDSLKALTQPLEEMFNEAVESIIRMAYMYNEDEDLGAEKSDALIDVLYEKENLYRAVEILKRLKHFKNNTFFREVFVRNLYHQYSSYGVNIDLEKAFPGLIVIESLKNAKEIGNPIANLLIPSYSISFFEKINKIERFNEISPEKFNEILQPLFFGPITLINALVYGPNAQSTQGAFLNTIEQKFTISTKKMFEDIQTDNLLTYYLQNKNSHKNTEDAGSPLDAFFLNRLDNEIQAQEDLIYSSFYPVLLERRD